MPHQKTTSALSAGQVKPNREALESAISADPRPSNTGVPSSQTQPENPQNVESKGGVDYLDVSLYGCWDASRWDDLRAKLEAQKEHAALYGSTGVEAYGTIESDCGEVVLVEQSGWSGGVRCRWSLKFLGGVRVGLVDRRDYIEGRPSVRVHIASMPCMVNGEEVELAAVRKVLASLGFIEAEDVGLSRVDVCVDLPGVSTHQIAEMMERDQIITRAEKAQLFRVGRKKTGFTIGTRSAVMCRVYDKAEEVKHDPDKRQVMVERRWGGELQEQATRVEFQISRAWLAKRFGIKKISEWREKRAAIVEYLTTKFLRLTSESVDYENKHQSRAETAPIWVQVQEYFAEVFGENLEAWLPPIRRVPANAEPVLVQAAGCVSTVFAKLGINLSLGSVTVLAELVRVMEPYLERIADDTERKAREFAFAGPLAQTIPISEVPF